MEEGRRVTPIIPLRGLTVLPKMVVNFDISRESSIRAVEAAMDQAKMIFLVTQQDPEQDRPQAEGLYPIGIASRGPYRHEDAKGDCACHGRGNAAGTSHFHAGGQRISGR